MIAIIYLIEKIFFFSHSQLKMKNKTVILRTFKRGHSLVGMIKLSRFYKPFIYFNIDNKAGKESHWQYLNQ